MKQPDTYTLRKLYRQRFKRNKVIVGAVDEEWEAYLVIMDSLSKEKNDYKYILTVIDVLSKYAWAETLKAKSGENLIEAFQKICRKGRQPEKLHTDKGTELRNRPFQKFLKNKNILFFTTHNDAKASIVGRFNRTPKRKTWKYFTAESTLKYIDVLEKLLYSYNHSRHRSIGMKPADVNLENESVVWQRLYGDELCKPNKYKFNVGDKVRISKTRRTFKKGYLPSWTEEILIVTKRIPRKSQVYKIDDYHGEELEGAFYDQELQSIFKKDSDFH